MKFLSLFRKSPSAPKRPEAQDLCTLSEIIRLQREVTVEQIHRILGSEAENLDRVRDICPYPAAIDHIKQECLESLQTVLTIFSAQAYYSIESNQRLAARLAYENAKACVKLVSLRYSRAVSTVMKNPDTPLSWRVLFKLEQIQRSFDRATKK